MSSLSLIVAASENNVIGIDGELPWRLSGDLRRFKKITMGHAIIMGRKTYESIDRLLPGRTTIIVTRQVGFEIEGALIANSVETALQFVSEDECPYVIGGAEVYRGFLPFVTQIHLTRVHAIIAGDTFLPEIDWGQWRKAETTYYSADEKNNFNYSFEVYHRLGAVDSPTA